MTWIRIERSTTLSLALLLTCLISPARADKKPTRKTVMKILADVPLIDGHNDVPWGLRHRADNNWDRIGFDKSTEGLEKPMHTDIPRLRKGGVGGQFWSVYVPVSLERDEAVRVTLEQIDVVHRLSDHWPQHFEVALTAADIVRIHKGGRIASLIGMEGGHSIGNSLAVLRMMYAAGARYMTLTHWKNTDWADAATDTPRHGGLSDFGRDVVREMNRLGMLVDLSHVSAETMRDALEVAEAPVIFSHSGALSICGHPRNVPDDVLKAVAKNGGVVMVDFFSSYTSNEVWLWGAARNAEKARLEVVKIGDPARQEASLTAWKKAHPRPKATLEQVVTHIDHIRTVAGIDHIGVGSDFDGMPDAPVGLEDVSKYPDLFVALMARGYSADDVAKIAGKNVLRALEAAEKAAGRIQKIRPASTRIFDADKPPKE